ncbi:MAG: hypothetical protein AB7O62_03015 [Pirellulales bacterium]
MNPSTARASATTLARQVSSLLVPAAIVSSKTLAIYQDSLAKSTHLRQGNFQALSTEDLQRLFDRYDADFFQGALRQEVNAQAGGRLTFRLSRRMTSTGGTTARFRQRVATPAGTVPQTRYEITVSTTLLYQTFADLERTVRVNGLECHDRLEALQRVFEHELLHLVEMLAWGNSQCSAPRYKGLARNIFAHTDVKHELVLQRERAARHYEVRTGDRVRFEFEGQAREGVVNRITRRATVLVENPGGQPYNDGKRYLKFYIPLGMLSKAE